MESLLLIEPSRREPPPDHRGPRVSTATSPSTLADTPWPRRPLVDADLLIAVVIFATAIAARWPLIERGETLLHSDEAIVGIMAQDIAAGRRLPIFFYGQRYMGALEAYVVAGLSPFVARPITALRLAPALFFASLTAVQFLMLRRWLGRFAGLVGAATLIAAAPMFAQWSISARGGYIEILLWGSLLIWSYGEWFVEPLGGVVAPLRKFCFGLLLGSGIWINPSIILFVVPIVLHALFSRPLDAVRTNRRIDQWLSRLGLLALPIVALAFVLLANVARATTVEHGRVRTEMLLGLMPPAAAAAILAVIGIAALVLIHRRTRFFASARRTLDANGVILFGMIVGALPAIVYIITGLLGRHEIEPALPLGMRPIWRAGETLNFFVSGLPLLFGADARPFLDLVCIGRESPLKPLDPTWQTMLAIGNWWVAGAALSLTLSLALRYRAAFARTLRLEPGTPPPIILFAFGAAGLVALYLLSGAAHDFNTIRYLIPLWAFIPGLVAAAVAAPSAAAPTTGRTAGCLATAVLLLSWSIGQAGLYRRLGKVHPLRPVADALVAANVPYATGELFDSHLLSYLTNQHSRIAEFEPFWPRLAHFRASAESASPVCYIVNNDPTDWNAVWLQGGMPGDAPPETQRLLQPALARYRSEHPDTHVERRPLARAYELFELPQSLPQRTFAP